MSGHPPDEVGEGGTDQGRAFGPRLEAQPGESYSQNTPHSMQSSTPDILQSDILAVPYRIVEYDNVLYHTLLLFATDSEKA